MSPEWIRLLETVESARNRLGISETDAFYRGHSDEDYELTPTLFRRPFYEVESSKDDEHNLYCRCIIKGRSLLGPLHSSWESLALFQHFGIPTRLLDWTDSFAVALFFALRRNPCKSSIQSADDDKGRHVWILNPFRLNNDYFTPSRIVTIGVDTFQDYFKSFVEYDNPAAWPYAAPVAVEIPWANERIHAQRGYFTIHPDPTPLNRFESGRRSLKKITIPPAAVRDARRFTQQAGIDEYSLFPDLHGLGSYQV